MTQETPLARFRRLRELTQREAAAKAGVSRQLWAAWESKRRPISVPQLALIRSTLGIPTTGKEADELRKWAELPLLPRATETSEPLPPERRKRAAHPA